MSKKTAFFALFPSVFAGVIMAQQDATPAPTFTIPPPVHCAVESGVCNDSTMQVFEAHLPAGGGGGTSGGTTVPPYSGGGGVCPATTFSYTAPQSAYSSTSIPSQHGHDPYNACGWNFTTPNGNIGDTYKMGIQRGTDVVGSCSLGYNQFVQNGKSFCDAKWSSGTDPYTAICNSDGTWHLYQSPPVDCYD